MPETSGVNEVRAIKQPLQLLAWLGSVSSIVFAGLGVVLVIFGSESGSSSIDLFGQTIETASVGVACIFIGAVAFIVTIRRILKTLDTAINK